MKKIYRLRWLDILALLALANAAFAELPVEQLTTLTLTETPGPHWVWVNDVNFFSLLAGRAYLVDADSGDFLGMLSTGYFHNLLLLPSDHRTLYSTQTYFSRGTSGERTDIVAIYDARTLAKTGEVAIAPKRLTGIPSGGHVAMTDDDRFVLVYNFAPAQSVTVVDMQQRRMTGEIETPGCSLVYPVGARRFFMICGDGSLLDIRLDDEGHAADRRRTPPLFDPARDLIEEDGVRRGTMRYFVSRGGRVYGVDASGDALRFPQPWSLLDDADRNASWRVGGNQLTALHRASGRLFVLAHRGGENSHRDPAEQIWVYDLTEHARIQRIEAHSPASLVAVSQDAHPLLYAAFIGRPALDIYDAANGDFLRSIEDLGISPSYLQPY